MSMPGAGGGVNLPPVNATVNITTTGAGAASAAMTQVANASGVMGNSVIRNQIPIRTMGDAMRQTASLMKYTVLGAFQNVGAQAIQLARTFDLSMSRIQGLVGESSAQVKEYSETVLSLAGRTARSPIELADSLYFITSAGIKGATALEVLKEAAESAAAGLGETNTVADALTSVLNAYGSESLSAARANDILVATVREGKAEADQFAPALGKVLPVAAAFGASFEDVSAGVAALTRNGASAGTSAIYLRQVLSQLLKPSKQAADTMFAAGTSAEDLRRRIQEDGLLNALEFLNRQLGGSETEIAATGLTKVFGNVRALTAVYSLLGPNVEENRKIFAELNDAVGDGDAAFEAYTQTADYKFKQSLAASQTAMIQLGREIMPVVTYLLELGKTISDGASALLRLLNSSNPLIKIFAALGKTLFIAGTAFFFLSKGSLAIFRTFGSLTRLMGNASIVFQGVTNGIRGTAIQAGVANGAFQGLIMTQTQEYAALNQLTIAAQANNLTMRQGLTIMAQNNSNLTQKALLTRAAAAADNTLAVSEQAVVNAANSAAMATNTFGRSLMMMLPQVMLVGTILMTAWSVMSMFKKDKGPEKQVKTWGEITDLLNTTIQFAKTGITINVDTNIDSKQILSPEDEKKIKEQLPAEFDDAISEIDAGSPAAAAYLASIITSLNLKPGKDREKILAYFEKVLSVTPAEVLGTARTIENISGVIGRNGEEAGRIAASNIIIGLQQGLADTTDVTLGQLPLFDESSISNLTGYLQELSSATDAVTQSSLSNEIYNLFGDVGKQIGTVVDETSDFGQLLLASDSVLASIESGAKNSQEAFAQSTRFLQNLTGQIKESGDLVQDARGNFQDIFLESKNQAPLQNLLTGFTGSSEGARILYAEIVKAYDAAGNQTPIEAFRTLQTVIKNTEIPVKELTDALEPQSGVIKDIADEFANGLSPNIQQLVDDYEAATNAIENFEKGQKAVMGIQKDFVEAQIDARDAFREMGEALGESGGKIDSSVAGDKAKTKIIDAFDEILNVTNILRTTDGPEAAQEYLSTAYQGIVKALVDGGTDIKDAEKFLADIGFELTGPGNLIETLFGAASFDDAGNLEQSLLIKVRDGLIESTDKAISGASPSVKKFNEKLLEQIKDFWAIKSPSKKAAKEIGEPIGRGIVDGITSPSVVAYMGQQVPKMTADNAERIVKAAEDAALRYAMRPKGFTGGIGGIRVSGAQPRFTPATGGGETPPANPNLGDALAGLGIITSITNPSSMRKGAEIFAKGITAALAKGYLKRLDDIDTPILDLIDRVVSDSQEALSTIGEYIDAQIDLQNALNENVKLSNEQLGYQAELNKAIRERDREVRRSGGNMGAEVTDYEQARIEELQKAFEEVSRSYSLRRATIADVIDAEDKLNEAREAASEVSQEQIENRNAVLDAQLKQRTAGLEASKAVYDVVESQLQLTEAAINFRLEAGQATAVFERFANQAFPGLQYQVEKTTGVMYLAGVALSDDNGVFLRSIKGLGTKIFNALAAGAKEATSVSTVPDFTPPATPIVTPTTGTGGSTPATPATVANVSLGQSYGIVAAKNFVAPPLTQAQTEVIAEAIKTVVIPRTNTPGTIGYGDMVRGIIDNARFFANGGLVTKPTLGIVGEAGPELILPLRGLGVTTALENMATNGPSNSQTVSPNNQIFNIEINNPVPETASDSISRRMKALSNSGLFG